MLPTDKEALECTLSALLNTLIVPSGRKLLTVRNLQWLNRNIWAGNGRNTATEQAQVIIRALLRMQNVETIL